MFGVYLPIVLAVFASGSNNVGKALQASASSTLPHLSLARKVLWQYVTSRTWLLGIALDVGGGLLMVAALALPGAQLSVLQPASGLGLVILSLYAHYFQEHLSLKEWIGAAMASAGVIALGYATSTAQHNEVHYTCIQATGLMCTWALIAFAWSFRASSAGPPPASALGRPSKDKVHGNPGKGSGSRLQGWILALQAGVCFGMSAACTRLGILIAPQHASMAALGLAASIHSSSCGIMLQTGAFQRGTTVSICTICTASAICAGVGAGVIVLGETLPATLKLRGIMLGSWLALLLGMALLTQKPSPTSTTRIPRVDSLRTSLDGWGSGVGTRATSMAARYQKNMLSSFHTWVPQSIRKWFLRRKRGKREITLQPTWGRQSQELSSVEFPPIHDTV